MLRGMWPQELGTKTERTARNQAGKQIDAKSARAKQKLQHPEKRQCNVKPDTVSKTAAREVRKKSHFGKVTLAFGRSKKESDPVLRTPPSGNQTR